MPNHTTISTKNLIQFLELIPDRRRKQGRRYTLPQILMIVIHGASCGETSIAACQEKAKSNWRFFRKELGFGKTCPDQTTIVRAIAKIHPHSLVSNVEKFLQTMENWCLDNQLCVDGKTLCGVHNVEIRHILSLFAGQSRRTVAQLGVSVKTNEIPAFKLLLQQNQEQVLGKLITGDAMFTQEKICKQILDYGGDYLFRLKENQEELQQEVRELFDLSLLRINACHQYTSEHGRRELTQIAVSSDLEIFHDNLRLYSRSKAKAWNHIRTIGKITTNTKRLGMGIDGVLGATSYQDAQNTSYFISSREDLTAPEALSIVKSHWQIENHLHRHKDMIFQEDKQTLRTGNAPQIMTFIRSFALHLLYQVSPKNLAYGFRDFNYHPRKVQNYFRKINLI
jgi:predicted transposase YbfD/YdcC